MGPSLSRRLAQTGEVGGRTSCRHSWNESAIYRRADARLREPHDSHTTGGFSSCNYYVTETLHMSASPFPAAHDDDDDAGSGTHVHASPSTMVWDAVVAVEDEEDPDVFLTMRYNTRSALEEEEDDDDEIVVLSRIYEAMCVEPSPSIRRTTPSRPSWRLADALSRRNEGTHAASSDAYNGVRLLSQVGDERSDADHGVLHLSQAERWRSQESHVSPASICTSPHYVVHNRKERLGRARQACTSLELELGLGPDHGDVSHLENHSTGESGASTRRAGTGIDGRDGEMCAGGGRNVAYAADILLVCGERRELGRDADTSAP